ncbi:hypothetical protein [Campylobacter lanienae]|uniref:hypothetical protein n=1 Tax=Campylobacter lanienae TaxID=75658 RepID=UPI000BB413CC|nr:hypothetical protein [Campylobacter lanienae]
MKLNELQMHPAPVSDAIFLGKIKSNKWVEKIDFTEQFYECLAQLCKKELDKTNDNTIILVEQFESGLTIEIKACIKS